MTKRKRPLAHFAALGAAVFAIGCGIHFGNELPEPADNELCFVCHIDFAPEEIVTIHARQGIGCIRCHGASTEHMHNEENVIPPDVMFERRDINQLCLVCHAPLPLEHARMEIRATGKDEVCVDCHGQHKVDEPRRRWDKKTRKLITPGAPES